MSIKITYAIDIEVSTVRIQTGRFPTEPKCGIVKSHELM